MSYPDVLNLFKHEAQLIKKTGCGAHRLYSFSIATNVAHSQKQERLLVTQSSLQSMLRLRLFVVRKQGCNQGRTGKLWKFQKHIWLLGTTSIYNHMRFAPPPKISAACGAVTKHRYSRLNTWWCTDQVIFHIKPVSRFRFHGNKSRLSVAKGLL